MFGVGYGLDRWEPVCGFESVAAVPFFEDFAGAVLFLEFGWDEFGINGEGASGRVSGDLFDGVGILFGFEALLGWEVDAGDLQAVEQETGAARVELVLGEFLENLADAVLNGAAIFHEREREGGGAAAASTDIPERAAGGLVVVAEVFMAIGFTETWAAAAASVGEDVSALEAFCWFGHGAFL